MDQEEKKKGGGGGGGVVFTLGPLKQKRSREKALQGGAHMTKFLYANKVVKTED